MSTIILVHQFSSGRQSQSSHSPLNIGLQLLRPLLRFASRASGANVGNPELTHLDVQPASLQLDGERGDCGFTSPKSPLLTRNLYADNLRYRYGDEATWRKRIDGRRTG
jgi:hypothetical protein